MAALTSIYQASLFPDLRVLTPVGVGQIIAIYPGQMNGTFKEDDTVQVRYEDGHNEGISTMKVLPILKSFVDFYTEAQAKTSDIPAQVLSMAAMIINDVTVGGKIRMKQSEVGQFLEAPLSLMNVKAKGRLRITSSFTTYWSPLEDPKKDPLQWLPLQVPGLQTWLLRMGYAAGLRHGQYVRPSQVDSHTFLSDSFSDQ